MPFQIYDSAELILVLNDLDVEVVTWARDRWFNAEHQSSEEHILVDVIDKKRRLAPYVSPLVKGKLVESQGYSTRTIKPAYLKPKNVVKPTDTIKRMAGEPLGGNLSPQERRDAHIRMHLMDQEESISRREEVQCMEGLRLSQVTITGDGYGTVVVSFGRDAALRGTLSGTDLWDDPLATPLKWIEGKARVIRQKSGGAVVRDIVNGVDAHEALKDRITDKQLEALLNTQSKASENSRMELGPRAPIRGARYEGRLGDFDFWTYSDSYVDEEGAEVEVMPADETMLVAPEVEGLRCYGAIMDFDAPNGVAPLRRFPKDWTEKDPSVEFLMTQAAPLMVPLRPNATGSWKVV